MKHLVQMYNDMKFRNKVLLSMMTAALIPFLLISAITGTVLVREVSDRSTRLTQQLVRQTSESLDVYLSTVEKLVSVIVAEGSASLPDASGENPDLRRTADLILRAYPEVAGITVAYDDDSCFLSGMTRISRDLYSDEGWYRTAVSLDGRLGILGDAVGRNVVSNLNYSSDTIFSVVKSFRGEDGRPGGVVLVDIRKDMIEQLVNRVSIGENGFLYVMAGDSVVYTPPSDIVYRVDSKSFASESTENTVVQIAGQDYLISNHLSDYSGWRVVGVMPRTESYDSVRPVYAALFAGIGIGLLLVFLFTIRLSQSVTRPVSKLSSLMEKVEEGDFSVRFNAAYQDEIGVLGRSFNHMLERMDGLIRELNEEKQIRLEAQLKSLQEQIKPHFLYNTLDTISWMARSQGAMDVVQLVDALTSMFRVGLSQGRDYIPLREEKTHVSNYLFIQNVRYKDRLQYAMEIPEELDYYIVPKLVLQPLVENAIYHGIKLKRGGGLIRLTGEARDDGLYLRVWDNGAGISADRLEELRHSLKENREERASGFGLSYIEERIRLAYGEEYGLDIASEEGVYTEVTLHLPLREGESHVQSIDRG